jgi:hypothetical protein
MAWKRYKGSRTQRGARFKYLERTTYELELLRADISPEYIYKMPWTLSRGSFSMGDSEMKLGFLEVG